MLSINDQIKNGFLVCPRTHTRLTWDIKNNTLKSHKGQYNYPVINGIPSLIKDTGIINNSLRTSKMSNQYLIQSRKIKSFIDKIKSILMKDFRTKSSKDAFKIFDKFSDNDLCLAIGGGPLRHHKNLVNINIDQFDNVDIIADAHNLPYRKSCGDGIFCEAVLEHLYNPDQAVKEMSRVMKPGGVVLSITPFLQAYHGFPHHYQNYTLTGHQNVFSTNGFDIIESGTCVGPTYTLIMLNFQYLKKFIPGIIGSIISKIFLIIAMILIKPLDLFFNFRHDSHEMATTTYVLAKRK